MIWNYFYDWKHEIREMSTFSRVSQAKSIDFQFQVTLAWRLINAANIFNWIYICTEHWQMLHFKHLHDISYWTINPSYRSNDVVLYLVYYRFPAIIYVNRLAIVVIIQSFLFQLVSNSRYDISEPFESLHISLITCCSCNAMLHHIFQYNI